MRNSEAMRVIRWAFAAIWLVALVGCASDQANRYYGTTKYPPKAIDEVQVLKAPPSKPYDVIADFQSRGETARDMQRKAAEIGADAVIVATLGGYRSRSDEWAGQDTEGGSYSRIVGTAIIFKEQK